MTIENLPIDTTKKVMITGSTGYVAGWLVKRLLEAGVVIHAPVRSPDDERKTGYLKEMALEMPGDIVFFKADLLEPGSYADAMAGCAIVFHTASPFNLNISDPQRDLVDPAVKGTRNVLETAKETPSVERVVLTSSCAAIFGDNADVAKAPNGVLTEDVWNTSSSLNHQPYAYSKTEAERTAWKIAKAQDRWKLVTINPSLVIGPAVGGEPTSESFNLLTQFGNGTMKAGTAPYEIGMVDVRDVADAHMAAAYLEAAEGRHITSAKTVSFLELGNALKRRFGDSYPFPTRELPKFMIWAFGPIMDKTIKRDFVAKNFGHRWKADNSKSRNVLGLDYRSVEKAAEEMFQQLVDRGVVKPD
jgi:dihydroflavonol-4-reductase